ncbi:MAG: response regulator [Bacteroidales bacterium]|nr:response regulator [Labilibaculum sp.]PCH70516.1 MAG: response regulator [Bacteroidales bacterium]
MKFNKNYKIFIVDDEPVYTEFISAVLNQAGFNEICSYENETEVLDNLYRNPQVIFLDYYLKDSNGLNILRKIKSINPDIFVVFLSSQEKIEIAVSSLKYGAFDYIIKNDDAKRKILLSLNRIAIMEPKKKSLLTKITERVLFFNNLV